MLPDRDHVEVAHMDHHEWVDHVGAKVWFSEGNGTFT